VRIVIFSDIHGNLAALQAVMAHLEERGAVDHLVINGDFCAFGPRPTECLKFVESLPNALYVQGNTDRYLTARPSSVVTDNSNRARLRAACGWAAQEIGEGGLRFLAGLPSRQVISVMGMPHILVVHGSTRSDEEGIGPETKHSDLATIVEGVPAGLLVCGHTHIPWDRTIGAVRLLNEGAVGFPYDGDQRACYTVVDSSDGGWSVDLHRVEYDVRSVIDDLRDRNHPATDIFIDRLQRASSR
jgi:putative phosphoesterase